MKIASQAGLQDGHLHLSVRLAAATRCPRNAKAAPADEAELAKQLPCRDAKASVERTSLGHLVVKLVLAALFAVSTCSGQGMRRDGVAVNSRGVPLAGAAIRVCQAGAAGVPCTPLAGVYSDAALTEAIAQPVTPDGLGNYFWYAAPGIYIEQISGPGITAATREAVLACPPNSNCPNVGTAVYDMTPSGTGHAHGLAPDPGGTAGTTKFLREDATWQTPQPNSDMGASGSGHAHGLAPDPGATAGTAKYLREDATWSTLTELQASGSAHQAGIAPDPGPAAGYTRFLREDATWNTVPSTQVVASLDAPGQTAAISTTTLYAVPVTGIYRVAVVAICTTAGTGSVTPSITYENGTASWTLTSITLNLTPLGNDTTHQNFPTATYTFYATPGTLVTYSTAYTATGTYALHLRLELDSTY